MAASRTPADTVPAEFKRQSERITEQLSCLNTILGTVTERLNDMSTMMEPYSRDLVTQFGRLRDSLTAYQSKAQNIYGDMSQSLLNYATKLTNYLGELTESVKALEQSVADL